MTTQPQISVIAPVYNVERYFERFLRSLLSQTMREGVEFIIVDDCTTDNCMALLGRVLEDYPERRDQVRVLHNPHNMGLTCSRNAGLRAAQGKYIYHCDSDDWLDERLLEALHGEAERTAADIVMCDAEMIYEDKTARYNATDWTADKTASLNDYINSDWTVVWNALVRKDVYDRNQISSPEHIAFCEDFHLMVRLCHCAKKIVHLPESLYFYNRTNLQSITHERNARRMNNELTTYNDIIAFLKERNDFAPYRRAMNWRLLRAKLDLLFDASQFDRYVSINPECHADILSCPYYYPKMRLMAWCLTHHMGFVSRLMLALWKRNNKGA